MILEESGGIRIFPLGEHVCRSVADEVYRADNARDWIFASAEDGELDGEDALVEATVTVGVGDGIPCGEDVGGVRLSWRTARLGSWLRWLVLCRLSLFLLGMERMI